MFFPFVTFIPPDIIKKDSIFLFYFCVLKQTFFSICDINVLLPCISWLLLYRMVRTLHGASVV